MTARGAVVVGASSPIGRAISRALLHDGLQVVGIALEPFDDESLSCSLVGDCANPRDAERLVAEAEGLLPSLDVIVVAAARMPIASAQTTSDDDWRAALASTLDSAFFVARAAYPHLAPGSSVVAVSSSNARITVPGIPGYSAAKAGLEGLVRQLAVEWGPSGVRVNAVAPGMIGSASLPGVSDGYPLGRTGTPEEVAFAVAFLASNEASFITGVTLPVDGGLSVSSPAAWLRPDLRKRWTEG